MIQDLLPIGIILVIPTIIINGKVHLVPYDMNKRVASRIEFRSYESPKGDDLMKHISFEGLPKNVIRINRSARFSKR